MPPARAGQEPPRLSFLDNGLIRLGVDLNRGGSIGYLADAARRENIVNTHDLGRWIGQSYYAGPRPFGQSHAGWKNWPWNPVMPATSTATPARCWPTATTAKPSTSARAPMQWALDGIPAECTFETWITLDGSTAQVRNRLTNRRADRTQYPALDQELPAIYTTDRLHRLFTYDGDAPFTDAPLRELPQRRAEDPQTAWSTFSATEHWAALVDDSDWGLGVSRPGVVRFIGGFHGEPNKGGPTADATGYLSPVRKEVLDHHIVYEYEYVLILDSLTNIRKYACAHRPTNPLPDYHFDSNRQHWWFVNAEDAGSPIKQALHVKLEKDDPQMIGPEGFWDAADMPKLYIRAAYHTRQTTAEVFWLTRDGPAFSAERRVTFPLINDGRFHTYEVDLAASPAYRGKITLLRFDPVLTGTPGDYVEVRFISFRKD